MSDKPMRGTSLSSIATAVGTVANLEGCKCLAVQITGLSGETIAMSLSMDGATFTSAIKPIDATTQVAAAAATLGNGYFYLANCPLAYVKFVKSAGAETVTIKLIAI
jgi:hypothetical protein